MHLLLKILRNYIKLLNGPNLLTGFTYAEILMAIIVLAIAIVPLLGQFYIGFQGNKTGRDVTIATNLAAGLMEEIRSKEFEDPDANRKFGIEPDEKTSDNREKWDDVDDYMNFTETPPRTIKGYPMDGGTYGDPPQTQPDFSNFKYEVKVESVEPTGPPTNRWQWYNNNNQPASLKANYKRVTVTVSKTDDSITPVTLITIRARY